MSLASHAYNAQSMANRGMLVNKNERDKVDAGLKQEELENQRRGQDADLVGKLAQTPMSDIPTPGQQQDPSQTPPPGQQASGAMNTFGSQVDAHKQQFNDQVGAYKTAMGGMAGGSATNASGILGERGVGASGTPAGQLPGRSNDYSYAEGGPVEAPEPAQGYTLDPDVVQLLGEEFLDRITSFVQVTKHQLQQQQSGPPSEVM
jgi:hypothetical protein